MKITLWNPLTFVIVMWLLLVCNCLNAKTPLAGIRIISSVKIYPSTLCQSSMGTPFCLILMYPPMP